MDRKDAREQLDYLRSLKLRLLGDRVLQRIAWEIAEQLDWPDTFRTEYLALTRLQADAFITLDRKLAQQVRGVVRLGTIADILKS
jgi:predicted nucleic acid-binding protein